MALASHIAIALFFVTSVVTVLFLAGPWGTVASRTVDDLIGGLQSAVGLAVPRTRDEDTDSSESAAVELHSQGVRGAAWQGRGDVQAPQGDLLIDAMGAPSLICYLPYLGIGCLGYCHTYTVISALQQEVSITLPLLPPLQAQMHDQQQKLDAMRKNGTYPWNCDDVRVKCSDSAKAAQAAQRAVLEATGKNFTTIQAQIEQWKETIASYEKVPNVLSTIERTVCGAVAGAVNKLIPFVKNLIAKYACQIVQGSIQVAAIAIDAIVALAVVGATDGLAGGIALLQAQPECVAAKVGEGKVIQNLIESQKIPANVVKTATSLVEKLVCLMPKLVTGALNPYLQANCLVAEGFTPLITAGVDLFCGQIASALAVVFTPLVMCHVPLKEGGGMCSDACDESHPLLQLSSPLLS
jgi:hypothetical protein